MTKVKICGLTREVDIKYANLVKPDYIGFIFAPKSRRYVSPMRAAELKAELDSDICAVGVFVDATLNEIVELVNNDVIDAVQLHGKENDDYIDALASQINAPIIKAFRVDGRCDVERARVTTAAFPLLDNGEGGTGRSFDWALAQPLERNYFLAGGLTLDNVSAALTQLRPYAIDLSSGVETGGLKDFAKMRAVVDCVRNLE